MTCIYVSAKFSKFGLPLIIPYGTQAIELHKVTFLFTIFSNPRKGAFRRDARYVWIRVHLINEGFQPAGVLVGEG